METKTRKYDIFHCSKLKTQVNPVISRIIGVAVFE